jgi:hypothetical protein
MQISPMKINTVSLARLCLGVQLLLACLPLAAAEKIPADRVAEIASWLPPQPAGFGWPLADRAQWDKVAAQMDVRKITRTAEAELKQPLPDQPDALFLEFSRNGNRTRWQKIASERRGRIADLTLAEALENRGRFIYALEQTVAALCEEKTWVYPAHDRSLENFKGILTQPDLGATGLAVELAEADYVLGDKFSPATRKLIRDNIERRVLLPFRAMVEGRQKEAFWLRTKMNWNAVCVANTVFAALALEPGREERAWFAAAGEILIRNSLLGFTPDGYCGEGIGYWNYGFGHNIMMAETLRRATSGKVDLFADDAAIQPALFCLRAEIFPGIYPSIADCTPGSQPAAGLKDYVRRRLGLSAGPEAGGSVLADLWMTVMLASLETNPPVVCWAGEVNPSPLRSFFPAGGVLISRSEPGVKPPFAVVLKGGHNDEPHNHNDLGSFSVILGKNMVICDPGGEVYTARTFGSHRYDSQVLSSFGHDVPVIAGQLQRTGRAARGVMVTTNFTVAEDHLTLDLRSAYAVPTLEKLERTFIFRREPQPALQVTDVVKFSRPESFETALVTWGKIKQLDANTLLITDGDSAVRVRVDTGGQDFQFREELMDEDVHTSRKPVRLGIALNHKVADASVTVTIVPASVP